MAGIDESIFAHVTYSMDLLLQLADSLRWFAALAAIIILTLTILLFFHDRRHEIGIYRALGDKVSKIIIQMIIEIGLITAIAFIFAIFASHIVSESISAYLFEQYLIEQMDSGEFYVSTPGGLELHNPGMMSVEEALALYDVTLDAITMVIFISIGSLVVLISTLLPVWYVAKLNPKRLLL